jgi:hypothetical protein
VTTCFTGFVTPETGVVGDEPAGCPDDEAGGEDEEPDAGCPALTTPWIVFDPVVATVLVTLDTVEPASVTPRVVVETTC